MPITVWEQPTSRPTTLGENPQIDLRYYVSGTSDDIIARAVMDSAAPPTYAGLVKQSLELRWHAQQMWSGSVRYGRTKRPEAGDSKFTFEIQAQTERTYTALEHVGDYAPSGQTAPNHNGALNFDGEKVQGTDVWVPTYAFSETHILPAVAVTAAYKAILFRICGRKNDDVWRGFQAGEVLFLGAVGNSRVDDSGADWEINYRFAALPTIAAPFTIANINFTDDKKGWDYMWFRFEKTIDTSANPKIQVMRPSSGHIDKVVEDDDFLLLGLGA